MAVIYFVVTYFVVVLLAVLVFLGRRGISRLRQEQRHSAIVYGVCFVLLASPWFPCLAVATLDQTPLSLPDVAGAFNVSYFVFSYSFAVLLLLGWFLAWRPDKHRRNAVRWLVSLVLFLSPWFPYGVVFAQTALFGRGLLLGVHQAFRVCDTNCGEEDEPILRYQVLRITPSHAEVLVVQPCIELTSGKAYEGTIGWVLYFQNTAHGWKYQDRADMPWSCGSADSDVFPPGM